MRAYSASRIAFLIAAPINSARRLLNPPPVPSPQLPPKPIPAAGLPQFHLEPADSAASHSSAELSRNRHGGVHQEIQFLAAHFVVLSQAAMRCQQQAAHLA